MRQIRRNLGEGDRDFRSTLAATISVLYFFLLIDGLLAEILLVIGIFSLLSSMMGFDPVYFLFKFKTLEKKQNLF